LEPDGHLIPLSAFTRGQEPNKTLQLTPTRIAFLFLERSHVLRNPLPNPNPRSGQLSLAFGHFKHQFCTRMPSQVPRTNTTKKREQLQLREVKLRHAIKSADAEDKIVTAAENFRAAYLSLLKAELYWAEEKRITGNADETHIAKIKSDQKTWIEKSVDEIIQKQKRQTEQGAAANP
jgi:hypothetical protein